MPKADRHFSTFGDPVIRLESRVEYSCNVPGRYVLLKTKRVVNWGSGKPKTLALVGVVEGFTDLKGSLHDAFTRLSVQWSVGGGTVHTIEVDTVNGTASTPKLKIDGVDHKYPLPANVDGVAFSCSGRGLVAKLPGGDKVTVGWTAQNWGRLCWYLNIDVDAIQWPAGSLYGVLGSVQDYAKISAQFEPRDETGELFTHAGAKGTKGLRADVREAYKMSADPTDEQLRWRTPKTFVAKFRK